MVVLLTVDSGQLTGVYGGGNYFDFVGVTDAEVDQEVAIRRLYTLPPLLPNWDIFEFQRFFIKAILQNIAKIIEIGTFLKNRDPPPLFSKFPN